VITNPLSSAGLFLVQTIFDFTIFIFIMRFLLQLVNANFYNPLSQMIVKLTNWPRHILGRILPVYRRLDSSTLIFLLILELAKFLLLFALQTNAMANISGVLLLAVADLLSQIINVFFYTIIIGAILSWVHAPQLHTLWELTQQLTNPLLRPVQKILPPLGGLDLSPLVVLIGLKLLAILMVQPMLELGAFYAL
jgi:YggT family protein